MKSTVAKNLEALRKKQGLTQEALAEKIGVSRQTVSNWEQGSASPDADNLVALSKLYGVTVDDLLDDKTAQEEFKARREAFFGDEDAKQKSGKPVSRAAAFPFPVVAVIVYFILGFGFGAWHPGWLVFLSIPIYYYIVSIAAKSKDGARRTALEMIPYPLVVVVAFLLIGFLLGIWHPTWILFLTIPLYYSIVEAVRNRGKDKSPMAYVTFPVFVVIAFLLLGFLANAWSWAWLVFLTIPIWAWLVKAPDKDKTKGNE